MPGPSRSRDVEAADGLDADDSSSSPGHAGQLAFGPHARNSRLSDGGRGGRLRSGGARNVGTTDEVLRLNADHMAELVEEQLKGGPNKR